MKRFTQVLAVAACVCVSVCTAMRAQDTRPALVRALELEQTRNTHPEAWSALLADPAARESALRARIIRGLGRVGDPALSRVLATAILETDAPWGAEVARAALVAAELFAVPELRMAAEARAGGHLDDPALARLLDRALKATSRPASRAAASRPAEAAAAAVADASRITAEFLDVAGASRAEGFDWREPSVRLPQIRRLHEMAKLGTATSAAIAPMRAALLAGVKHDDPAIRRTAIETVAALAPGLAARDRAGMAQIATAMVMGDPIGDVRRAAVLALATLDAPAFFAVAPTLRLNAPWYVRSGVAEAIGLVPLADAWAAGVISMLHADPDRRVRTALLEALAVSFARWDTQVAVRDAPLDCTGTKVQAPLWPAPAWFEVVQMIVPVDRTGQTTGTSLRFFAPRADDPVEIALSCAALAAVIPHIVTMGRGESSQIEAIDVSDVLSYERALIPACEAELLQSVIALADLAAKATARIHPRSTQAGEARLRELSLGPERSIRPFARAKLAADDPARTAPDTPIPLSPRAPLSWQAQLIAADSTTRATLRLPTGDVVIKLFASDAPRTVANFVDLARRGFYDNAVFHRVVPGFVAQAGCPRGDGWGGPGYTIPCEINDHTYTRGTVGMALAGKDTGGSQWFICLDDAERLDMRYTIFGAVESGMEHVDRLLPGDPLVRVTVDAPAGPRK